MSKDVSNEGYGREYIFITISRFYGFFFKEGVINGYMDYMISLNMTPRG